MSSTLIISPSYFYYDGVAWPRIKQAEIGEEIWSFSEDDWDFNQFTVNKNSQCWIDDWYCCRELPKTVPLKISDYEFMTDAELFDHSLGEPSLEEKLKHAVIQRLTMNPQIVNDPYLVQGNTKYTRQDIVDHIGNETSTGMEFMASMLAVALDMIRREINPSLDWIPINVDELPEGEVLAANFKVGSPGYREKLVGWIGRIKEPFCESDDTLLPDVTHYINIHKFDIK